MSKAAQIIERFFKQDYPEDLRKKFSLWLIRPQASDEKESRLYELWNQISAEADVSTEVAYRHVAERLDFAKRKNIRTFFLRMAQIAACILVPLLSAVTAYRYVQNHLPQEMVMVECYVPNSEIREIQLPDGSVVLVNSGTILLYPKTFTGKIRSVYLTGEAKFTVSSDKEKTFIVKTKEMNVEALGTVFNVSSYPDQLYTAVTLVEGKISVKTPEEGRTLLSMPGEQLAYDREKGIYKQEQSRLDYVLAWEKGRMVFQSASLYAIIRRIERRYDVTIYFDETRLERKKVTVKFIHDETLEEVLYTLQQIVTGFHYKMEGKKIYIY